MSETEIPDSEPEEGDSEVETPKVESPQGLEDSTLEFEDPGELPVAAAEPDYKVQLDIFEGPLDLLLYLIKRDEIDIYDISIDRITKQYMTYLDAFRLLNF